MTLTKEDKINLSDARMQKAKEFLEDAKATLIDKRIKTSINRSYYAAPMSTTAISRPSIIPMHKNQYNLQKNLFHKSIISEKK